MKNHFLAIFVAAALTLVSGITYAGGFGSGGLMGGQQGQGQALAQGPGGTLTTDAVNAYIDALEFCLAQVDMPETFSAQDRQEMAQIFAQGFTTLPVETQQALVNMRDTWTQYHQAWPQLPLDEKKGFAYGVLALAYGEDLAAEALGMGTAYTDAYLEEGGMGDLDITYE